MPYAPGITDISGQILAQGMVERSRGISAGIENFIKGYEQNQALKRQAMSSFAGAAAADPELLNFLNQAQQADVEGKTGGPQVPPEVLKAYARAQKGDVDLYDASILGNFAGTYQKTKSEAQQRQLQAAQIQAQQAQAAKLQQDVEEAKQANQYFQNLMQGQAAPQQGIPQQAMPVAPQESVPAQVPYYLARPGAPAAAAAPAAAQPPVQALQAMQGLSAQPAGMPTGQQAALELFMETRKRPNAPAVNARLREMQKQFLRENQEQLMYPTFEEANAAARGAVQSGQFATGTIPIVKQDPASKRFFLETTTTSYEPPEVSSKRVGMETTAKEEAISANKFLDEVSSNARAASSDLYRVNKSIGFLEQGVPTGPLTPEALKVKALMLEAGLLDAKQAEAVKRGEELISLLNEGAFSASQRYLKGSGSVSNEERNRVDLLVAEARKTPGANLELLKTLRAAHMKDLAADAYRRDLRRQGLNPAQIRDRLEDWINSDANSLDRFMGRVPSAQGVKELTVSSGAMGETKVVPQAGAPANSRYVVGKTYTSKKDGKDYVWDGSKMVPVQ